MKEEFTTAMHEELIGKEMGHTELMAWGAFGAMQRGMSKQDALKKYEISETEFQKVMDANDALIDKLS